MLPALHFHWTQGHAGPPKTLSTKWSASLPANTDSTAQPSSQAAPRPAFGISLLCKTQEMQKQPLVNYFGYILEKVRVHSAGAAVPAVRHIPLINKGKRTGEVGTTCVHKANLPVEQGSRYLSAGCPSALTWPQEMVGIGLAKLPSHLLINPPALAGLRWLMVWTAVP